MDPKKELEALVAEAAELKKKSDFTDADVTRVDEIVKRQAELKETIAKRERISEQLDAASKSSVAPAAVSTDAPGDQAGLTLGERFVKSEAFTSFKAQHPTGVESKNQPISIKAAHIGGRKNVFKADPAPLNTSGADLAPTRLPGLDDLLYRKPTTLLDIIYTGTTDSPWLQYRQLVSMVSNAAIVAEAKTTTGTTPATGLKPLSTLATRTADAKAHTYADGIEVTNQELTDDGALTGLVDGFLTQNVREEIERVILAGAGTADEPAGILETTGVLEQAFATDMVTSIRKAKTLLTETSSARIQAIVLNPEDDEEFDLLKDVNERFYGGGPFATGPSTIWSVPRIVSSRIPVGTALMGDFSQVQLLIYEALSVLAFNQHKDYAQRNLTYIRAELRALQLIRQPAKLAIINLTAG